MTPESLTDPSEESRLVPLTDRELQVGKSSNKALEPSYTDPSLLGPDMADDVELSDWLWSLRKTIRASSDNEKLYPPGEFFLSSSLLSQLKRRPLTLQRYRYCICRRELYGLHLERIERRQILSKGR